MEWKRVGVTTRHETRRGGDLRGVHCYIQLYALYICMYINILLLVLESVVPGSCLLLLILFLSQSMLLLLVLVLVLFAPRLVVTLSAVRRRSRTQHGLMPLDIYPINLNPTCVFNNHTNNNPPLRVHTLSVYLFFYLLATLLVYLNNKKWYCWVSLELFKLTWTCVMCT